jgi:pilus assembly protein FimV
MSWKMRVLVLAMLFAPPVALPLGLGEIRLGSALNEPLSAEIDLVAATPEELGDLQAHLASRELFQRYGLDRPAYLDSLEFRVGRGQDGRSVLLVRSQDAIGEPFVSFLIDVSWPRGRLLREYTVLLDPPVFAPQGDQAAPAAIVAPRAESAPARAAAAPAAGAGSEPAAAEPVPSAESPPAQSPPAQSPPAESPSAYRVASGDTLYEIARSLTAGDHSTVQKMVIGLFRANPAAFQGNINVLRAGAILRVPTADELSVIGAGEASAEVSRQVSAWRSSRGAADSGRLRLVTPTEGVADTGTVEPVAGGSVESQVDALEREIGEQRRLLELKNQELAELQRKLARTQAAAPAIAVEPEKPAPEEMAVAPEDDTGVGVPPPEEAKEPTVAAKPKPQPAPEVEAPSFFDSLTDNWLFLLGAAALVLLGGLGYGYVRRRREQDVDDALKGFEVPATAPVPTEAARLRSLVPGADETVQIERLDEEDIVVEEQERPIARPKLEAAQPVSQEDTISTEAALDLDQADPLAEADFHMAYGLYDQACDLVRMALKQSPDRNDLKLKLAEIHFVAGDAQAFLAVARDLRNSIGPGGNWDRIVIMGRQLAPDEALFAGGVQSAGVDISLEGGDNRVDLDLLSAPAGDEGLDFDLGQVLAASDSNSITGERETPEFNQDEGPRSFSTTQKITPREGPGTVEMPTLELPSSETPTVETPTLRPRGNDTIREHVSDSDFSGGISTEATAELAIDDLGLHVGGFESESDSQDDATIQATHIDETMRVAAHDESTRIMPKATDGSDATAISRMSDADRTALLVSLKANDAADINPDAGSASDSAGTPTVAIARLSTEQLPPLSDLQPVTMSEVGTKLDLARAYMDMGDPDGARNILQEVLNEGSASQKQEARRLIDSLPGA